MNPYLQEFIRVTALVPDINKFLADHNLEILNFQEKLRGDEFHPAIPPRYTFVIQTKCKPA